MAIDEPIKNGLSVPWLVYSEKDSDNTAKIVIEGQPFLAIRLPFTPQSAHPEGDRFEVVTQRYSTHFVHSKPPDHPTFLAVRMGRASSENDRILIRDRFEQVCDQLAPRLGSDMSLQLTDGVPVALTCPIIRVPKMRILAIVPLANTAGD